MKHRDYWFFEHILKEYVFLFSFVRSYSRPLPKKFANKSKKVREQFSICSRTLFCLSLTNSQAFIILHHYLSSGERIDGICI